MAVQQLAKKQAKKEKKKQDDEMQRKEEENLQNIEDTMKLMEKRRKKIHKPKKQKEVPLPTAPPKDSGPGGPILKAKDGGMMNKRLTKTVPPKKGPNSQGMRGTGAAIRGTKFKGVF
jgi:hypothetical protein